MLPEKMSLCAFPQVKIYEDFDKMSAKEVYYNEAGKKITVKLLHFPEVPPEEINQIKFDEEEQKQLEIINGNKPMLDQTSAIKSSQAPIDEQDQDHVPYEDDEEEYFNNQTPLEDNEEDEEKEADEAELVEENKKPITSPILHKKALRKKSSGNLVHGRKVSMAFAQAHGLPIVASTAPTTSTGAIPKTPPPTPTIMIPPKSLFESQETIATLRKHSLLNRRSPSPHGANSLGPGYAQYSKSLLEVPLPRDYGYASSDDLSSEWDSDVPTVNSQNKKVRLSN